MDAYAQDPLTLNASQTGEAHFSVSIKHYVPYVVAIVIVVNLLIVNVFLFLKKDTTESSLATIAPTLTPMPLGTTRSSLTEEGVNSRIDQATESVKMQILSQLSVSPVQVTPTSTPIPTPTSTQSTQSQTSHVYFVPLGTGFGNGTDWTTISQIGATIDTADYGTIASVVFEASVRIPTGNQTVYVRLLNADTGQSLSGSDLTLSGGTPSILTSPAISLTSGSHLYQVQLKTQLGYTTYIDFARLRITANN